MKKTNFDKYINREVKRDPRLGNDLKIAGVAIDVSVQIYQLRKSNGMTQKDLAELTGVKQSNIARLEQADYEGYSLKTLNKMAKALNVVLKVTLEPKSEEFLMPTTYLIGNPVFQIKTLLSESFLSESEENSVNIGDNPKIETEKYIYGYK